MKCICGALLTSGEAQLWRTRQSRTDFSSLNELRLQLQAADPRVAELDWEDFGRGAIPVKQIMLCAALTVLDAPEMNWSDCSVIGWNGDGCARENSRYFADYLDSGRVGGRGSLFVPTLPSIPFCEAAIMLKSHGSGAYFSTAPDTGCLASLLPLNAERFILTGEITSSWSALLLWDMSGDPDETIPAGRDLRELFTERAVK